MKQLGAQIIYGVPQGIIPDKEYTVTFSKNNVMRITDGIVSFTLYRQQDKAYWETSQKNTNAITAIAVTNNKKQYT